MTFLTPHGIILYSDTRKKKSTNFISNFEKCIFYHILIQIGTISMYTGRPHKLKDSYDYKTLNLNKVQIQLQHEHICLEYQKAWIERSCNWSESVPHILWGWSLPTDINKKKKKKKKKKNWPIIRFFSHEVILFYYLFLMWCLGTMST